MPLYAGTYEARQGVDAHGVLLLISNRPASETANRVSITSGATTESPNWLPVGNVVDVAGPSMNKGFHDVTPSIPGAWKQAIPGFKEPGNITFGLVFDPDLGSHSYLLKSFRLDWLHTFRIVLASSSGSPSKYWEFKGYVSGVSTSHQAGGIIVGNVNVKVSGAVTMTTLETGTVWPDVYAADPDSERVQINT